MNHNQSPLRIVSRLLLATALTAPLLFTLPSAKAQTTYEWNAGAAGSVFVNTNWDPNTGTPGGLDTAEFSATSTQQATVPGTWDIANLNKTAGGLIQLTGSGFSDPDGVINISGNLTNSSGNNLLIRTSGRPLSVSVGGTFSLTNNSSVRLGDANIAGNSSRIQNFTVTGSTSIASGSSFLIANPQNTISLGAVTLDGTFNPIAGVNAADRGTPDGQTNNITMTSLSGSGTIVGNKDFATLTTIAAITVDGSSSTTFSGAIQDGLANNVITLTKAGSSSTLTLSGTNTYTGATTVSAGTLLIDGSLGNTAVTVDAGATLGGSGTIGGTVNVSGNLNPGNSPGDLTINNSLTLAPSATLNLEITGIGAGEFDRLINDTTDTFTFDGTLALDNTGYTATLGDSVTVFSNWGGFSGTFDTITGTDLGGGLSWDTSNLGVNGSLTVIPEPSTWALVALSLTAFVVFRRRVNRS